MYIAGYTGSSDFPVTKGAFETTYIASKNTAFVSEFNLGAAITSKSTSTTLTASVNPQLLNNPVTFTAAVALLSGASIPTGSVVFSIDEQVVGTVALNSAGKATYATSSLAAGDHYILASYAGNSAYSSSGDGLIETINLPVAALPVISPAAGAYPAAQFVTITDTAKGAVIYYTLGGSAPTTASTKYTGPINVNVNETVMALAAAPNYTNSPVASAAYNLVGWPSGLAAPATAITSTTATLNAYVNTLGLAGTCYFQYGTSSTLSGKSPIKTTLGASTSRISVSAAVSGLTAKTRYYYQVVVSTAGGTALGAIQSFTTN